MGVFRRGKNYFIDYYVGPKRSKEMVGPNRREAEAALGKKLALIREGKFFDVERIKTITFEEMADKFKEWLDDARKSDNHRFTLPPAREHFKGRLLASITEEEIEAYRAMRRDVPTKAERPEARRPRSSSTLNHELSILKQLFAKAISWGYLEKGKNPADDVKKLPEPKGRVRFLSAEEARALIEAASPHLRPIIITALETGMRRGEILNLTWDDVDSKNGTLYVAEAKNGTPRHVPMSNRLRATLATLPRHIRGNHIFTGQPKIKKMRQIGKPGEPFRDVDTSFENACAKAGITGFRFHDLRHTAASHMVMAGVPMKTVGEILGHKTAAMTERYSHLTPEHKRNAVEILSAALRGENGGFNRSPIGPREAVNENGLREGFPQPVVSAD